MPLLEKTEVLQTWFVFFILLVLQIISPFSNMQIQAADSGEAFSN